MSEFNEKTLLLNTRRGQRWSDQDNTSGHLSAIQTIVCLVDLFGVLPSIVLPKSLQKCGIYGAFLLTLLVIGTEIFTAILLSKAWQFASMLFGRQVRGQCPFTKLAAVTYNGFWTRFVAFLLNLAIFATGIPNFIIASECLELFFASVFNANISFCYWLIIMGIILCPIVCFGIPKNIKLLCTMSVINLLAINLLLNMTIITDDNSGDNAAARPGPSSSLNLIRFNRNYLKQLISTYGLMIFQFNIHPFLLSVQNEMINDRNIVWIIITSFIVVLLMVISTTTSSFLKYGTHISDNILENLPKHWTSTRILTVLVIAQLLLSLTLTQNVLLQRIERMFDLTGRRFPIRSVLILATVLMAEAIPWFEIAMSLIGGTLTGPLIFIFPPLFYFRIVKMFRFQRLKLNVCILSAIAVCLGVGSLLTFVSTVFNFFTAVKYVRFQMPCLLNITLG